MTGQQDDERVKPPEVQSEEVHEDPPEVQAANKALDDPNLSPDLVDKAKKMLQARKDAEQAEEGEPKTKAERAYEKAKDDFLEEFSTVDENGKPKIPQDEGEALAEILAKALMALMTPLRMGAAASGMTQAKDDALDAMADKAKATAGDLLAKMKDVYNKKDDQKEQLFETMQGNQVDKEPEVGGGAPAPKPDLAVDLSKQSQVVEHAAKGFMDVAKQVADKGGDAADYVIKGLGAMKNALGLAGASAKAQADPTAGLSDVSGNPDPVKIEPLLSQRPGLTPDSDRKAAEANSTSFKPKPPAPAPEAKSDEDKSKKLR